MSGLEFIGCNGLRCFTICNDLVIWSQMMSGTEAAHIAEVLGVPIDKLLTVMKRNSVMTPPIQGFIESRNNQGDTAPRAFFAGQAGIGEKDLSLALGQAGNFAIPAPIISQVQAILKPGLLVVCEE